MENLLAENASGLRMSDQNASNIEPGRPNPRLLRLGGLSGLLSGAVLIAGFLVAVPLLSISSVADFLERFSEVGVAYLTAARAGYITSLLYMPFLLALYYTLRKTRPAMTLLGSLLGFAAAATFVIFFLGLANTTVAVSTRYASATLDERATLVLATEALLGVLHGIEEAGIFFLGLSFIAQGLSVLGSTAFPKAFAWMGVIFGIAVVTAPFTGFEDLIVYPLWAIFSLSVGWKTVALPRAKQHILS